jgi:lysophospholipase L1-like esterase
LQKGSPLICARSLNGYPQQLARMTGLSIVDRSCGGATAEHVLNGGQFFQEAQTRAVGNDTRLVTITVGGNDVGYIGDLSQLAARRTNTLWGLLVRHLWEGPAHNRDYARLERTLITAVDMIHRRAPSAKIVIATYPTILPPSGTCPRLGLSIDEAQAMRDAAAKLATTTTVAAHQSGALLVDMNALGVTHSACSDNPWTRGWTNGGIAPFHPTFDGARATAEAILSALRSSPTRVAAIDKYDAAGHQTRGIGRKK